MSSCALLQMVQQVLVQNAQQTAARIKVLHIYIIDPDDGEKMFINEMNDDGEVESLKNYQCYWNWNHVDSVQSDKWIETRTSCQVILNHILCEWCIFSFDLLLIHKIARC